MIRIPLTPEEFQSKAASIAAKQGITFTGHEGVVEKMGVKARWVYEDGMLTITIIDKPFFLSEASVEEQLKKFF